MFFYFFFSSRRRHTRWNCDWSSDVCSSDLSSLDLGCGPGRDLKAFAGLGHVAVGLEGSEPFAIMAREHSGCEVWRQDLLALKLPDARFDGVFANAVLF